MVVPTGPLGRRTITLTCSWRPSIPQWPLPSGTGGGRRCQRKYPKCCFLTSCPITSPPDPLQSLPRVRGRGAGKCSPRTWPHLVILCGRQGLGSDLPSHAKWMVPCTSVPLPSAYIGFKYPTLLLIWRGGKLSSRSWWDCQSVRCCIAIREIELLQISYLLWGGLFICWGGGACTRGSTPIFCIFKHAQEKQFSVYNASVECKLLVKSYLEKKHNMSLVFTFKAFFLNQ